jgi:hypothetical protein
MDSGQPATKADLQATKSELQASIADTRAELRATRDELRAEISASADRLTDSMRQFETNLVTAFRSYAKGQNARVHNGEVGESDMKLRLSALEDRVLSIETRLPSSAA